MLAASVFHFGEFGISEVKKHLISKGINVRMGLLEKFMNEKIIAQLIEIIKERKKSSDKIPTL